MLGERRIQATGQCEGIVASRSTGQIGATFRSDLRLSAVSYNPQQHSDLSHTRIPPLNPSQLDKIIDSKFGKNQQ